MDESYRKILHATVRCAVVTRSRSATMRSFVPKIGTKRHTYPHTHKTTHYAHTQTEIPYGSVEPMIVYQQVR